MNEEELQTLIHGLTEIERLKTITRGTEVLGRKESTAEHAYNCILLADQILPLVTEELDHQRIRDLLLYHDLVEVYSGDSQYTKDQDVKTQAQREQEGFEKLLKIIPQPKRYEELYEEFEELQTREAQFAKAIDYLEPLVNGVNEDRISKNEGFTEQKMRSRYDKHMQRFELTEQLYEALLGIMREHGKI